jgi:hypothetical protein
VVPLDRGAAGPEGESEGQCEQERSDALHALDDSRLPGSRRRSVGAEPKPRHHG